MTRAEAIEVLENELQCVTTKTCDRGECRNCPLVMDEDDIRDALELAINHLMRAAMAVDKQIHKRPKIDVQKNYVQGYEVEDTYVHCPVCGYRFYSIVNGEECAGRKTPYCPICGQKIDWEG